MPIYFIVNVNIGYDRSTYDEYIEKVCPIVESYGGVYLARTENVESIDYLIEPDRVIVIRFPNRQALDDCFADKDFKALSKLRTDSVESRALIVEGLDI